MEKSHEAMLRKQLKLPNEIELAAADLLLGDPNLSKVTNSLFK